MKQLGFAMLLLAVCLACHNNGNDSSLSPIISAIGQSVVCTDLAGTGPTITVTEPPSISHQLKYLDGCLINHVCFYNCGKEAGK